MSEPSSDSHPEHLLAHEPWLGALARRLVRDEDEAEDVVQETLRRALEAPPRESGSIRSFLASIARHFAYDGARRKRRREQREQIAARIERTPATVELLARLDRQRDVLDEVLGLEEPFREAVLLRYYEELKPRVIAKRLGIPVTTVKSRLRRGQERLRDRLRERYGERDWRAALAPLLALPATSLGVAAVPWLAALASSAALAAGAWQLSAELDSGGTLDVSPSSARAATASSVPRRARAEPIADEVPKFVRRAAESARPERPAIAARNAPELVRWPEETLLWIDLDRGVLSAPANDLCAVGSELLASPRAVVDALAAGRGGVLFLPRDHEAARAASTSDEALELHVLDAQGRAAQDLPVRVLWRGDGEQRVLWRGRTQDGRVSAPGLKSAIERLLPRGEILASFDFPLADVRACVLSAPHELGETPCLQAPPSGAVRIALRDPWGAELAPGACAVLRARQPDGTIWEQGLDWHAGEARFAPVALGAELEIEVRAPDLPPAVHRIAPLADASEERLIEIVAGRPGARCTGRLLAVGAAALLERSGLAEVGDESGGVLARWRFDVDEHGAFVFACAFGAAAGLDPSAATRLRLWVGSALAEIPFAWPAPGQTLALGEIALVPALELAAGRVVDERGTPLAGAHVRVDREGRLEGDGRRLWLPHAHARTDAEGRFRLCGAGSTADRFEIEVDAPGTYFERRALDPARSSALELVAQRGGAIEGEARIDAALDASALAVLVHPSAGPVRVAKLDPNGAFRIDGLPPGYATIDLVSTLGASPSLVRSAPCCVAAGGTVAASPLDARGRVRSIERRVLDGRGPCAERALELRGTAVDGPWTWRGRTDRDGCLRVILPIEIEALDLVIEGDPRLRFDARAAHGWVDLASEAAGR